MRKPLIILCCLLFVLLSIPIFLGIAAYQFANYEINETHLPKTDLQISEQTEHYTVFGENHWEIRDSMNSLGPNGFDAYTSALVTFDLPCGEQNPKVTVEISYDMPQLQTDNGDLQEEWDEYYAELCTHQKNHGKIAIAHAQELLDELYELELTGNCFVHHSTTLEIYTRILSDLTKAQKQYDFETDHGATEGVVW